MLVKYREKPCTSLLYSLRMLACAIYIIYFSPRAEIRFSYVMFFLSSLATQALFFSILFFYFICFLFCSVVYSWDSETLRHRTCKCGSKNEWLTLTVCRFFKLKMKNQTFCFNWNIACPEFLTYSAFDFTDRISRYWRICYNT